MTGNSLCNALINCIFVGQFVDDELSNEILLRGFRDVNPLIFEKRKKLAKDFYEIVRKYADEFGCLEDHYEPFYEGLRRIRTLFNVDDIIKMLRLKISLFEESDFKLIVDANPDVAKELYQEHVNRILRECDFWEIKDKLPNFDEDIIRFGIKLSINPKVIKYCLSNNDIDGLKSLVRLAKFDFDELFLRRKHFACSDDNIKDMLAILEQAEIKIVPLDKELYNLIKFMV